MSDPEIYNVDVRVDGELADSDPGSHSFPVKLTYDADGDAHHV